MIDDYMCIYIFIREARVCMCININAHSSIYDKEEESYLYVITYLPK